MIEIEVIVGVDDNNHLVGQKAYPYPTKYEILEEKIKQFNKTNYNYKHEALTVKVDYSNEKLENMVESLCGTIKEKLIKELKDNLQKDFSIIEDEDDISLLSFKYKNKTISLTLSSNSFIAGIFDRSDGIRETYIFKRIEQLLKILGVMQ